MTPRTLLVLLVALCFPILANAQAVFMCQGSLLGSNVVPSTDSPGGGYFWAVFATEPSTDCPSGALMDSLAITLEYQLLSGTTTGAAIYVGEPGSNGTLLHVITADHFASGDTLYVKLVPADCPLLESGCYVTIETDAYPNGEVRGQLSCGVSPTVEGSWGTIRTLFR